MSAVPNEDISPDDDTSVVDGVGPARAETLADAGIETVRDLQNASDSELLSLLPADVARSVQNQVGNVVEPLTTAAEARDRAQQIPGAKHTVVRGNDGKQHPKVLRKVAESHEPGASIEIHKG